MHFTVNETCVDLLYIGKFWCISQHFIYKQLGGYFRLSVKCKIKIHILVCYQDAEYKNPVHVKTEILECLKVRKKNVS